MGCNLDECRPVRSTIDYNRNGPTGESYVYFYPFGFLGGDPVKLGERVGEQRDGHGGIMGIL